MPKRRYQQFCPAARTLDVIGERWTLLIVRDLLGGPRRYTDLRNGLPGMASNLLAQRLGEMIDAGLIVKEHRVDPDPRDVYLLTPRGEELEPVLMAVGRFGLPYLDLPTDDEPLVPERLPEGLVTMLLVEELDDDALTVRFALDEGDFTMDVAAAGVPGRRRSAAERITVSVAGEDDPPPTRQPQVTVLGSLAMLLLVRRGDLSGEEALGQGLLTLDGSPGAVSAVRRLYGFEREPVVGGT